MLGAMRKRQRQVLLVLGWYDHRLVQGVERYAQEHGWHLSPGVTRERIIPWGWNGDGILAWLGAGDDLAEFVVRVNVPTVDFSFRRPHLKFTRVLTDHAATARLVAEHYLSRGFTNFMFYSDYDNWSFEERGAAFVSIVQQAGWSCTWLRWHRSTAYQPVGGQEEWKHKRKWLSSELKRLPKPLAVFAGADWMAVDVLETCETAQLNVPEQVAIVGPENSLLSIDTMRTPITCVEPNLQAMGYRGAALLDDLIDGKPAPEEPIRIPPSGLMVRKSSNLYAVNHEGVAKGLRFITDRYHEAIGVTDVAKAAGLSVRGLQQAFIEHIGRSPRDELHRVRLDRAKQLLVASGHKTETVAAMCGYPNVNSFWVTFRKATGISPAQYRKTFDSHLSS